MFHPYEYAGPVRIPPPKYQVRVRKEALTRDTINARNFENLQSEVPVAQSQFILQPNGETKFINNLTTATTYDMAPLTSRTVKRDYRRSVPFDPKGPGLAMNPYFDRYDPTRDPRNAVRELRGVVYEDKEADRGIEESRRIAARGYSTRWIPEEDAEKEVKDQLLAYERMRPTFNDMSFDYRLGPSGTGGASGASGAAAAAAASWNAAVGGMASVARGQQVAVPPP